MNLRVNMEWVRVDNHSGDVDKVLGLLECVCQRPLYEMIASVGSEWRSGGIDLRLLGCLFVFPTVPWRSDLWLWRR